MSRKALFSPDFFTFAVVLSVLFLSPLASRLCYAEEAPPSKKPPVVVAPKAESKEAESSGSEIDSGKNKREENILKAIGEAIGSFFTKQKKDKKAEIESIEDRSTHHEVGVITIPAGDQKVPIHTFCIDSKGRLLATCGGARLEYKAIGDNGPYGGGGFEVNQVNDPASIKVLSPKGDLLDTWKIEVTPQALNVGPDGTIFAGGSGKLIKLSSEGKVLKVVNTPNFDQLPPLPEVPKEEPKADTSKMTDKEKEKHEAEQKAKRKKIEELSKKQNEYGKQLSELYQKMQKAEKENDEKESAKIAAEIEKIQEPFMKIHQELSELTQTKRQVAMQKLAGALRSRSVPGIAVAEKDLFVVCSSSKGYGFEVWRMNHDFEEPLRIVKKLSGCCGQMDIQTHDGKLWVAENGRKRVRCFDRDGKQLVQFGADERKEKNSGCGFGSCCNPMNIRFNDAGDVYTAEASVGRLKRFSADGKFIETVARLKIVPGCKHVAIGVVGNGDRLYMLDITRSHIAVIERKQKEVKPAVKEQANLEYDLLKGI